jgi:hypothetical protein
MTGKKIYAIIALAVLSACGSNKGDQRMIGDKQLTIQVQKVSADDGRRRTMQVRIFPKREALSGLNTAGRENLLYRMDSCFYLETGTQKVYPSAVLPVANGMSAAFEYLVSFDGAIAPKGNIRLIYQDRYLNKKKYELYNHL